MLRSPCFLLLCFLTTALFAQSRSTDLPYTLGKDGSLSISNGYALVLTHDGRGIVYHPADHFVVEQDFTVQVLSREKYPELWREIKRLLCGCDLGEVCINGRCYRGFTQNGNPVLRCNPPCEGGYVCINGNCLERPFEPIGTKGWLIVNGQPVRERLSVPRTRVGCSAEELLVDGACRGSGRDLAVLKVFTAGE